MVNKDDVVVPPKKGDIVAPPKKGDVVAPPKKDDAVVPPQRLGDVVAPPKNNGNSGQIQMKEDKIKTPKMGIKILSIRIFNLVVIDICCIWIF